jgi:uncharacterized protein YaiL (DUF2058 family)
MKKPQPHSLQDQLLKAGLANANQAKQVKAEKRKQQKLQRNTGIELIDEVKLSAEQTRQQQAERDRELNLQRKQAEEQKALAAQIKQIVDLNRIPQTAGGLTYQFNHSNKVKTVFVDEKLRNALANGRAGIVGVEQRYEIVPAEIARKIQSRDAACVLLLNDIPQHEYSEEDPYAAYQVPDDLMW